MAIKIDYIVNIVGYRLPVWYRGLVSAKDRRTESSGLREKFWNLTDHVTKYQLFLIDHHDMGQNMPPKAQHGFRCKVPWTKAQTLLAWTSDTMMMRNGLEKYYFNT